MRTAFARVVSLATFLGVAAVNAAFASGEGGGSGDFPSFPSRNIPDIYYDNRPPVDRAKYSLGQKVFDGRVSTPGVAKPEEQKPQLLAVQSRLPKRTAKKKDLTALAGNLTPTQFGALAYYVEQRYHSR